MQTFSVTFSLFYRQFFLSIQPDVDKPWLHSLDSKGPGKRKTWMNTLAAGILAGGFREIS